MSFIDNKLFSNIKKTFSMQEKYNRVDFYNKTSSEEQIQYIDNNLIESLDFKDVIQSPYISLKTIKYILINKLVDKNDSSFFSSLSNLNIIDEEFIIDFSEYLNFNVLTINYDFSEEFLYEHINTDISKNLNYQKVAEFQTLSEKIIKKYHNNSNSEITIEYQELSEKFINENIEINGKTLSLILEHQNVSEEFLEIHISKFTDNDFNIVSKNNLSNNFIQIHQNDLDLMNLLKSDNELSTELAVEMIEKNINNINFDDLAKNYKLPLEFIKKYFKKFKLNTLLFSQELNSEYLESIISLLEDEDDYYINGFNLISIHQDLPETFIKKHLKYFEYNDIVENQTLSEDFIIQNENVLIDNTLIMNKKLSEEFIIKFNNKFSDYFLLKYQDLSNELISTILNNFYFNNKDEFKKSLSITLKYQNLDSELLDNISSVFEEHIDYNVLSQYQNLSEDFIKKNEDKINYNLLLKNNNIDIKLLTKIKKKLNFSYYCNFYRIKKEKYITNVTSEDLIENRKYTAEEEILNRFYHTFKIIGENHNKIPGLGNKYNKFTNELLKLTSMYNIDINSNEFINEDYHYLINIIKNNDTIISDEVKNNEENISIDSSLIL